MYRKRHCLCFADCWRLGPLTTIVAAIILGDATPATAQRTTLDTLSLLRLPGVMVVVAPLHPQAEEDGLRADSLQHWVTAKLADAGVPILTEDQWQQTLGSPVVAVKLNLMRPSPYLYVYNVELELKQLVTLMRDSTPAFATTWEAGSIVGTVQTANLGTLRGQVFTQVDRFISAYNAAQRIRRWW